MFDRSRPFHPSFGEMRDENPMFFNNFYNFMPNFLPFSLMNNPFSSPFFPSNPTISETFTNFPQNPFTKLTDSLEKMDLKGNNPNNKGMKEQNLHQKFSEDLRIISLSHLDGQEPEKFIESKDFSITPRMEMNMEENPSNFLQANNFNIKTENIDFMNLRVRKFSDLNPAEKVSNDMKLAVVNVKKNEIYFLQQNLNSNNINNNVNVTSDSSYKSGSFISINNSNTSNSFSARLDSIENNEGFNAQQDMRRSKFVKFSNNE